MSKDDSVMHALEESFAAFESRLLKEIRSAFRSQTAFLVSTIIATAAVMGLLLR